MGRNLTARDMIERVISFTPGERQGDMTTGFGTPLVSGGRRPSLLFGRGVEVGLAHRAARLGTWPKTRSWRS